ncbi:MAG: hypothetical protein M3001_11930 [Staphylococcus epidermidis]|nr:hypothetical protein [Staphylococcus epidermidis]
MVNRYKEFMDSLHTKEDVKPLWQSKRVYPNPVDEYRGALKIDDKDIIREVSYNLQYLEFMVALLDSFYLHNVVRQQTTKYFVINAASVIEAILLDYIKGKGWSENKQIWITDNTFNSISKTQDGQEKRISSSIQHLEETKYRISFAELIDMTCNPKSKKYYIHGLGIKKQYFNNLRSLRNMVHLAGEDPSKSSFHTFNDDELNECKKLLHSFLVFKKFCNDGHEDVYNWLIK